MATVLQYDPYKPKMEKVLIKNTYILKSAYKNDVVFKFLPLIIYTVKGTCRKVFFDGSNVKCKVENFPFSMEEDAHWGTLLARLGLWLVNHHSISSPCQGH